ncbi:hypothetical protein HAX54_005058 [Datura stramonium]|uniref:Uncharacterized protein n=1 Tax=Datura stramonium TaxID=4076 RepID=A0ABS8TAE0_DATST|nr:hypothetical protein [Datura stramonium]
MEIRPDAVQERRIMVSAGGGLPRVPVPRGTTSVYYTGGLPNFCCPGEMPYIIKAIAYVFSLMKIALYCMGKLPLTQDYLFVLLYRDRTRYGLPTYLVDAINQVSNVVPYKEYKYSILKEWVGGWRMLVGVDQVLNLVTLGPHIPLCRGLEHRVKCYTWQKGQSAGCVRLGASLSGNGGCILEASSLHLRRHILKKILVTFSSYRSSRVVLDQV